AGLLLGDRTELPRDVDDAFRRAGVYHVLAVSGFNVAILAASVWALCRLLRLPHRVSAATAIVVVIGFALVVGPEPSVLRAVVMAVLVLMATLLDRDASVTNSLALAALAILAVRPGDLHDPGFQLSFAATLGIVTAPPARGAAGGLADHPAPLQPALDDRSGREPRRRSARGGGDGRGTRRGRSVVSQRSGRRGGLRSRVAGPA